MQRRGQQPSWEMKEENEIFPAISVNQQKGGHPLFIVQWVWGKGDDFHNFSSAFLWLLLPALRVH